MLKKLRKSVLKNEKLLLFLIVILAFILRFYSLDNLPALNADEAAIGYNAYSLIQTGKDEHGNPWPIHFQSFNDYKPGLYFYIVLPFVKFFGLNIWSVRVPAAFLGVLTVVVVYFLVKEIFDEERIALISSLFLAISPWHIHFSRGGWEVNVATFFITLGVFLFLKGLKRPKLYLLSAIAFVLSLYTYHAARIVVPLLALGLGITFWKELLENKKFVILAALLGIITLIPLGLDFTRGGAASRVAGVGLFADPGPKSRIEEQRNEHGNFNSSVAKIIHNKAVNYSLAFLENWGKHYWGEFLFLSGDEIQRNKVPETGQMYLVDIIFVGMGLIGIVRNYKKRYGIILFWLIVAPVAAALTFQAPHALRAHNMVVPLVIISAYGFIYTTGVLKKYATRKVFVACAFVLSFLLTLNFMRYIHMYYYHMARQYPFSSQYGVKELVEYINSNGDRYKKILVTDRYDQPYILFLFYLKYPPEKFQKEQVLTPRDSFGFSTVNHFDKYYFTSIKYEEAKKDNPGSLMAGTDEEIPSEANIVKIIFGPNDKPVFKIVAN